jgi:hypothetical protein
MTSDRAQWRGAELLRKWAQGTRERCHSTELMLKLALSRSKESILDTTLARVSGPLTNACPGQQYLQTHEGEFDA